MVATPVKNLTLEGFLALPETKPASEYIDGKIVQKPMPQGKHSLLQLELISFINSILRKASIAIAFPELRCSFGGRSIVPDVVVLKNEIISKDDDGEVANVVTTAPDWVIEILSPDQSTTKVIKNILHCLDHGTKVGWLIDPAEKMILVYQPDKQVQVVDILEAELIVPEFARSVKLNPGDIFNWLKLD
ncbi:Uma2 family endonuclease [Chamaesiphon sp. VAR_48_metabat_135_sub]|uniref:Uma2 family endonuclease n=1 Tax=Chamaesiphon sp. VAR_48_metabat_135_sub TaxID=2964699 RepID=UPI00286A66CC|nr:Uma2 family endonuclease [Chamaesiphon sp. VAR_48_metabat_135_sub]